ncbi:nitrate ABC transporter substrate-binding protein [Rhodobacteraceae bacterium CCMM004]|nr:nitrate ABC transporter substrate-binding protein [Rhodobacteraceae bacterium CCMM004]
MPLHLTIVMRDWDFVTPLLLGELSDPRIELDLRGVATLPGFPSAHDGIDGAEVSVSRLVAKRVGGDARDVGVASFPMRAFRHRCIITRKSHPAQSLEALRGGRIGVAGWQDSGNTWTRHAMVSAGVGLDEIHWFMGRMTSADPVSDGIGQFAEPGRIDPVADDTPLLDLLEQGALDAVFAPFMPEGFFGTGASFRPVLPDLVGAEMDYFGRHGFVPGIHAMALKQSIVKDHPWLPQALSDLLETSRALWTAKRQRYSDTSPWLFDEHLRVGRHLPDDWDASGVDKNAEMLATFIQTAFEQGLIPKTVPPQHVFASEA